MGIPPVVERQRRHNDPEIETVPIRVMCENYVYSIENSHADNMSVGVLRRRIGHGLWRNASRDLPVCEMCVALRTSTPVWDFVPW